MAIVQGSFGTLLAPGLIAAFKKTLEEKTGINDVQLGRPDDHCLHVYDLGDGMLVPCQLVDDLFEA